MMSERLKASIQNARIAFEAPNVKGMQIAITKIGHQWHSALQVLAEDGVHWNVLIQSVEDHETLDGALARAEQLFQGNLT